MTKHLAIYAVRKTPNKYHIHWHRYNEDPYESCVLGTWIVVQPLEGERLLDYARTMCESDIQIALELK